MGYSLDTITDFKVAGIPVGSAAVGLAIAGVGDAAGNTIATAVPMVPSWAAKAALAFATYKFGGKVIGKDAANLGALFLAADAVGSLIPIRSTVSGFTASILSKLPLPQLGAPAPAPAPRTYSASPF